MEGNIDIFIICSKFLSSFEFVTLESYLSI
uniref:Uncharacterized protein n=1 Tax=Lepeophtheirus salmonis TaxID=72036 RepID=A0A0K2UDX2_LEPSM